MKFKIYTLGCKVNQYESQAIREFLLERGWSQIKRGRADCYIVNTCTVTHTADVKSIRYIRKAKKENPKAKVVVIGCLVEKDRGILEKERADILINQSQKEKIFTFFDGEAKPDNIWFLKVNSFSKARAFVKIQDGCNNACSFCKVRIVRGRAKSRLLKEIEDEVFRLTRKGFREIVLCGTDLGSWQDRGKGLSFLLGRLLEVKGLGRIRISSLEPKHVNDDLLKAMSSSNKICAHLHLPFQSGSDKVLRAMNKQLKSRAYYAIIDKIRERLPDCGISCDIMAGFPGETEEDFCKTKLLIEKAESLRTHVFPYSPREGTLSYKWPGVSSDILKKRVRQAISLSEEASFGFRKSKAGRIYEVIFDMHPLQGYKEGYTENYIRVKVPSNRASNQAAVQIGRVNKEDTFGVEIAKKIPI